jgi:hypothetical protein
VLLAALAACAALALLLPVGGQPDEHDHLQALRWFTAHGWPPPIDADGVGYSAYGTSRVYTGEWSYWLRGRLAALGAALDPALASPRALRLHGLLALALTLAPLLFWPAPGLRLDLVAVFLVTVPQVLWSFAYLNGDAWTIAAATLLLRVALAIHQGEGGDRRLWLAFGAALGLVAGVKINGWVIVPFALALAGSGWWRRAPGRLGPLVAAGLVALALAAPLRIVYPLTQPGSHSAALSAMRSHRAEPRFDPRQPMAPGFRLRQRGVPLSAVAASTDWWLRSAASSYAMWGPMTLRPPLALPLAAAGLWIGLTILNLRRLAPRDPRRWLAAGAALAVAALVAASLYHSWSNDYQPQGRYLFPALAPLALLVCGFDRPSERLRTALLVVLAGLGAASMVLLLRASVPS